MFFLFSVTQSALSLISLSFLSLLFSFFSTQLPSHPLLFYFFYLFFPFPYLISVVSLSPYPFLLSSCHSLSSLSNYLLPSSFLLLPSSSPSSGVLLSFLYSFTPSVRHPIPLFPFPIILFLLPPFTFSISSLSPSITVLLSFLPLLRHSVSPSPHRSLSPSIS